MNILLKAILTYYLILIIILLLVSIPISLYLIFSTKRLPILEITDTAFFNKYFKILSDAMYYDMSYGYEIIVKDKIPNEIKKNIGKNKFLTIGTGNGVSDVSTLKKIFGANTKIILSDLKPQVNYYKKLETENITYINESVDINNIEKFIKNDYNLSLIGALHHLDKDHINSLFRILKKTNKKLFIIDPRKYNDFIHIIHLLTLPFFGIIVYSYITFFGSARSSNNILESIIKFLLVPFFMTLDNIIGGAKRYDSKEIIKYAREHNLNVHYHESFTQSYYIIS